jgi:uncharacterized BrkB/YihY/UPF0761 family membrane protein
VTAEEAPGHLERLRARYEETQARVEAARGTVRGVDAAFVVYDRDRGLGGNLLACAVAYRFFFWSLPLVLLLVAVLGFADAAAGDNPEDLAEDARMSSYVVSSVGDAADQARESRFVLLGVALFALYLASAGGAKTLRTIHLMAWRMQLQRSTKGWLGAAAFAGFGFGALALALLSNWIRDHPGPTRLTVWLGMLAFVAAFWFAAELLLPHGEAPWTRLLPGALLFSFGIEVLHLATVLYFGKKVASSSELYGGLGVAAGVLLWLYLFGRLIVASAVLNATLWERHLERSRAPSAL